MPTDNQPGPRRRSTALHILTISAITLAFIALGTVTSVEAAGKGKQQIMFQKCSGSVPRNCVVDGDTFWIYGQKIRIADIDTPEVSEPGCAAELSLGKRATSRLIELINDGPFDLRAWQGRDQDATAENSAC